MFQSGDKILVKRPEGKRRQKTIHDDPKICSGSWVDEKPVMVEHKATIGQLGRLFIPIVMSDGSSHLKLYPDLSFGKGYKVSWKAKKADLRRVIDGEEVVIKGKQYIARGVISPIFKNQHIPVILNGESKMIPLNQVVLLKEKK